MLTIAPLTMTIYKIIIIIIFINVHVGEIYYKYIEIERT